MHSLPKPLTPSGTRAYLTRKEAEYLALKSEIEMLRGEIGNIDPMADRAS